MNILITMPVKTVHDPLISLGKDYLSKVKKPFNISLNFLSTSESLDNEASSLLKASENYKRILLVDSGLSYSSEEFSFYLEKLSLEQKKICFIIGGAFGLAKSLLDSFKEHLSLSKMTLPHRLAFLLLSEQIYRAYQIRLNSPYHK